MTYGFTNIQSLSLNTTMSLTATLLSKSLEKLSTGYRINRAADDAAGLSISEKFLSQIKGYEQSIRNTQDGDSLLSIADGSMNNVSEHLQRIRELTVQAGNSTLGSSERSAVNAEINQRLTDINRIADTTKFNNINLLNSSAPATFKLQIGPGTSDTMDIGTALGNSRATAIGLPSAGSVNLSTATAANNFLTTIDTAINTVNTKRSTIGAYQNRLDSVINNLSVTSMNISSANSRIRDTDIASETSHFVRNQLLQQYGVSLMSQVNSMHSTVTLGMLSSMRT